MIMDTIIIDFKDKISKTDILKELGEKLDFAGQSEVPNKNLLNEQTWGMNWDALNDCLRNLEDGGIWGNSHKWGFPLVLKMKNIAQFKTQHPQEFQTLLEILDDTKQFYAENDKDFQFHIE
jgi:RNAse (barnase) inhibitor barstar